MGNATHRGVSISTKTREGALVRRSSAGAVALVRPMGPINKPNYQNQGNQRRPMRTKVQTALIQGFGEQVAKRCAKGAGKDKRDPEQRDIVHRFRIMQDQYYSDDAHGHNRTLNVAQVYDVDEKVTKCGAQTVREQDGDPESDLSIFAYNGVNTQVTVALVPDSQCRQKPRQQDRRSPDIAEPKGWCRQSQPKTAQDDSVQHGLETPELSQGTHL